MLVAILDLAAILNAFDDFSFCYRALFDAAYEKDPIAKF